ncbi:MAG: aminodeoxychorismate synthase component I [Sphingomonadales bacterium]|nr:aminodeoxychorismate synthase component I [Sphingomonadales bacterium]
MPELPRNHQPSTRSPRGWADFLDDESLPDADDIGASTPFIILDDAREAGGAFVLANPFRVLVAHAPHEVAGVLDEARQAVRNGALVAGYLAYEAGIAFEPRLDGRLPLSPGQPLVWLGCFSSIARLNLDRHASGVPREPDVAVGRASSGTGYQQAIRSVLRYIDDGDIYQANLTFQSDVEFGPGSLVGHYLRLRSRQQAGWGGLVWTGAQWLLSFSPEQFFSMQGGRVQSRPMKGTSARASDPAADRAARERLVACGKERAENLMIVDLIRNDLSRIAIPGTVKVPELFAVETYPTVHQMTSLVTAELLADKDAFDVIRACFPCGSITGAPKIRAMEIIAEIEQAPRGPYTGSMGLIRSADSAAFNVLIRTLVKADSGPVGSIGVGSGITAGSNPASEWAECRTKLKFVDCG